MIIGKNYCRVFLSRQISVSLYSCVPARGSDFVGQGEVSREDGREPFLGDTPAVFVRKA